MYEGIRKKLGLEGTDCSERLIISRDMGSIREELEKLIGIEVVAIWKYGNSAREPDFEGGTFRQDVVKNIETTLFFEGTHWGAGLDALYDVVPVETLQEGGELKFYTFRGNNISDGDEFISVIDTNPVAAVTHALKTAKSYFLFLEKVEKAKPGVMVKHEEHYAPC